MKNPQRLPSPLHATKTGGDDYGRSAASPAARKTPAALFLVRGSSVEQSARRDAVGGAVREPECRGALRAGAAARRWTRQRDAAGQEAVTNPRARRKLRGGRRRGRQARRDGVDVDNHVVGGAARARTKDEGGCAGRRRDEGQCVAGGDLNDRGGRRWQARRHDGVAWDVRHRRQPLECCGAKGCDRRGCVCLEPTGTDGGHHGGPHRGRWPSREKRNEARSGRCHAAASHSLRVTRRRS
jgi:hypothetical protein